MRSSNVVYVTAGREMQGMGKNDRKAMKRMLRAVGADSYTQSMRAVPVPITT